MGLFAEERVGRGQGGCTTLGGDPNSCNMRQILLSPLISSAVSTMLTQLWCTIAQPYVEYIMAIKNDVEVGGLRKAYLHDGAAFVSTV